ncbi:sigma-70 family RNA polymerase sigma factor [Candidatus Kaiserbacteria bacterium]|nr:MAG: sigma-70 family RNA polymerase sigma factor [Candidatus Kaiserbacteria bacterium]
MSKKTSEHELEPYAERASIYIFQGDARKFKLLKPAEEYALAIENQNGNKAARERLILCNLRLVVNQARKFSRSPEQFADFAQCGSLGLLKAVKHFDPKRGIRFSTYAYNWINSAIFKAFYKSSAVLISQSIWADMRRILKAEYALMVAEPEKNVTNRRIAEKLGLPEKRVRELRGSYRAYSMDSEHGDRDESTLHDTIADTKQDVPKSVANRDLISKLLSLIDHAKIAEKKKPLVREALIRKFGLTNCGIDDCYEQTITEIAEAMNITPREVLACLKLGQRVLRQLGKKLVE